MTANHVVKKLWWVSSSYTIKTAPSRSTTNITKVESTQKGYWEISQYISEANFHSILRWIGPVNPHPNGHGPFLHFCMTISVRNSHCDKRPKIPSQTNWIWTFNSYFYRVRKRCLAIFEKIEWVRFAYIYHVSRGF